jgi:hypothetical protein
MPINPSWPSLASQTSTKDATTNNADKPAKKTTQDLPVTPIDPVTTGTDESFEVGRAKKGGSKIDYASTVEDAYDQLNSILGSEGVKRLTDDTQKLMQQQMQLAESMKGMGPMIKNLEPMMNQAKQLLENQWSIEIISLNYIGIIYYYAAIFYVFGYNPIVSALINIFVTLIGVIYLVISIDNTSLS